MNTVASVTNDGSYAVVTAGSGSSRFMRVFDLQDCIDGEYTYTTAPTTSGNCASRDFKPFISSTIPSFNYFTKGEFLDNDTISFYHQAGSPALYSLYLMKISDNSALDYMALGDSISSGEGAFSYVYPTDEDNSSVVNKCHTSDLSFPYLINDALSLDAFSSFACSGATIVKIVGANGIVGQPEDDPYSDNQYYNEDYDTTHYWTPGFDKQINKVMDQKPNVLTVTIGANDIGFEEKITSCLEGFGSCYESYEDRKELATEINRIFYKTSKTFSRLKSAAASDAKVYAIGYPNMVKPGGACMPNVQLTASELQLMEDVTKRINLVIEAAAAKAGVLYVDIEDALAGHRHCEGGIGNVAVNGVTAGDDLSAGWRSLGQIVIGRETYHPNKLGHRLIRDAVIAATSAFTAEMPEPDSSVTIPVIDDSIPLLANATKTNRLVREASYNKDLTANNLIYKSDNIYATVNGFESSTKSGSSYQVEIHSTPISLGTFTSDDNGNIDISAAVPSSLDPGYHTLHVYGKDIDNKDIDIYKTIYIAATEEDWDGDEIDNDVDPCVMIEPSQIDEDEDDIDDACDPIIGDIPDEDPEEQAVLYHPSSNQYILASNLSKYIKPEEHIHA